MWNSFKNLLAKNQFLSKIIVKQMVLMLTSCWQLYADDWLEAFWIIHDCIC